MKAPALIVALTSLGSAFPAIAQQPDTPDTTSGSAPAASPRHPWLGVAVEEVPAAVRAQLPL